MSKQFNRAQQTTATTGTGTVTLGAATTGYQTLASAGAVTGDPVSYVIRDGTAWEIGTGTYTSAGTTLSRTLIQSSTGSLLNLSGAAVVTIIPNALDLNTPDLFGTPGAPQPGLVRLGESALGGFDFASMRNAVSPERFIQPLIGRTRMLGAHGLHVSNQFQIYNMNSAGFSLSGASGNSIDLISYAGRQSATCFFSGGTAGTSAGFSCNAAAPLCVMSNGAGGGGFSPFIYRFAPSGFGRSALAAATRGFWGLTSATTLPGNVNPATLTNVIGIAKIDGSNNLNIVFGGSAAQTPIDLGANFPATAAFGNFYELALFSDPNNAGAVTYQVTRWTGNSSAPANVATGTITNTTPGTTLPASSTVLTATGWVNNNTDAASRDWAFNCFFVFGD